MQHWKFQTRGRKVPCLQHASMAGAKKTVRCRTEVSRIRQVLILSVLFYSGTA